MAGELILIIEDNDRNLKLVCNVPVGMTVVSVSSVRAFRET